MLVLRSPSFEDGAPIPRINTCEGDDRSPGLAWSDAPSGTRSFVLIVDDPDAPDPQAPKRTWVHWIRYNIPPTASVLAAGAGNAEPAGPAREAITDDGTAGYHGPCPPIGRHRYFFRLYALDTELPDLGPRAHRADVERAMQGNVLADAVLMGTYAKGG